MVIGILLLIETLIIRSAKVLHLIMSLGISATTGSGTAVINIIDGAGGQIVDGSTTTIETDVAEGIQTVVGQFSVLGGSDNPDPDSLVFDISNFESTSMR
ncbi:hypothetical protein OH492_10560 [Vibrio chagasii]|nr:hypothetical protein [Vibrio chagasii]